MSRSSSWATLAAVCVVLAGSAQAQLPNPLRKAKEKAGQALSGQQPAQTGQTGALKFDNTLLELTPQVVDRLIAGLKVRANYKDANGHNSAQLRRRADELYQEAQNLGRDRDNERFEYNNKAGTALNCRDEYLRGAKDQAMQEAIRKMMTPGPGGNLNLQFMTESSRLQTEMAQAHAAGDTTKVRKLQADLYKLFGLDFKADSVKANASCGVPPMPAWMARADAASDSSTRLYNQARDLEVRSADTAIRVSGLGAEQFAMGAERVTAYVQVAAGARGLWKFTVSEETALKARLAELQQLVG